MDKIDEKIDALMQSKLVTLIQENSVRTKRINTKFTQMNKKNTLERVQAYFDSNEKMLRSIPKDLLRIEREVRQKFVTPLLPERVNKILTYINAEGELLFGKLDKEMALEFKKLGQEELYLSRVEAIRKKFNENRDTHLQKCAEALETDIGSSARLPVKDLCALYGLRESFLHELNLVEPLQKMHVYLKDANEASPLGQAILTIVQSFKEMIQNLQDDAPTTMKSVRDRKSRKMQVAKETMSIRDLMLDVNIMLEYASLPVESRNEDATRKIWKRVSGFFEISRDEWKEMRTHFESIFNYILDKESNNA